MNAKYNLYTILVAIIVIMMIIVIGNVIVIGEKIATISHFSIAEYLFYALLISLFFFKIIKPMLKIYRMPEFPILDSEKVDDINEDQLEHLAKVLKENCYHLNDEERNEYIDKLDIKKEADNDVKTKIKEDLKRRTDASKSKIGGYAVTVFLTTSISQNGKIDSLIIILMNLRMIYEMIMATGFRPKITELIKIYKNVLSTALFSYITSEALAGVETLAFSDPADVSTAVDDMDIFGLFSKKKTKGAIVSSIADGTVNTLLTCRIGYITQKYLEAGPNAFIGNERKKTRKEAIYASFGLTKDVMVESIKGIKDSTKQKIAEYFEQKAEEAGQSIDAKIESFKKFFNWGRKPSMSE